MNKGAVIAGIIGLGALGVGAYALTRNSNSKTQHSSSDSAFNGFTGGGATGDYSKPTLAEQIGTALNAAFSTPINSQVEPFSEIIPEMQAMQNPSDEVADVKQSASVMDSLENIFASRGGSKAVRSSSSRKVSSLMRNVTGDQNSSSSTTPAEYNQGNSFTPAPKQADMSSYNKQKTGGNTDNTPKQTSSDKKTSSKPTEDEAHAAYEAAGGPVGALVQGIGGLTGWW